MEKKTIGRFISALRKAKGLTQRELAEKLNVSDKAVSRWERDESAPDLSLIPVIAEIFGVSSDELLRGERFCEERERPGSPQKSEKQMERLLQSVLTSYRIKSIISIGMSFAGILAAMICNFGFNRAYVGFFTGCVLLLAAKVCQSIFTVQAFSSLGNDFEGKEVDACKNRLIDTAVPVFSIAAVVFAACLPLIIFPGDAHLGLSAGSWALYGSIFSLVALSLCTVALWLVKNSRIYKKDEITGARLRLKLRSILILAVLILATAALEFLATYDYHMYAESMRFDNYEDFKSFMAQPLPWESDRSFPASEAVGPAVYYDSFGNRISEKEAHTRRITNIDGDVVCEYTQYNEQVVSISYPVTKTCLPIHVINQRAMRDAQRIISVIHDVFAFIYALELAAVFLLYLRKRSKM